MEQSLTSRLPSRMVSFQSAEIVTVSELSKLLSEQSSLCGDLPLRSVRVTGVLIHHNVNDNYLDIADPLSPSLFTTNPNTTINNHPTPTYNRQSSIINPYKTSLNSTTKPLSSDFPQRTPSVSKSLSVVGGLVKTPNSSGTPAPRRVFVKKQLPSSISGGGRGLLGIRGTLLSKPKISVQSSMLLPSSTSSNDRSNFVAPSTPATTTSTNHIGSDGNTAKKMFTAVKKRPWNTSTVGPTIRVDVTDVTPFEQLSGTNCMVGDLVMIIGEIQPSSALVGDPSLQTKNRKTITDENDDLEATSSNEGSSLAINRLLSIENEEYRTHSIVRARIARNVNGTDMKLFEETLRMRRKYLRERYGSSYTGPGCGLPLAASETNRSEC